MLVCVGHIHLPVIGADIFLMSAICAHPSPIQIQPDLCVSVSARFARRHLPVCEAAILNLSSRL